jgi:hypothetical protein
VKRSERASMIDDTLYFFFRKKVDLDGDFFLTPGMDWMNHVTFFLMGLIGNLAGSGFWINNNR